MKNITSETAGLESSNKKKEKKMKKSKTTPQATENSSDSKKSEKKIKRKRKASWDTDNDEGKSDTSSELGQLINLKIEGSMKKSKKKKMKTDEEDTGSKEDNPNTVSNFRIFEPLRNALKAKGIKALFPIQARTFDSIYDGLDLIGKAKTGQGV